MSSYTTSSFDANPEFVTGYNAVVNGMYQIAGSVSIRDYADTPLREASVFETTGIMRALDDIASGKLTGYSAETRRMLDASAAVALAEAVEFFGGDLDEIEAAIEDWRDSRDYADTCASIRFGFQMF